MKISIEILVERVKQVLWGNDIIVYLFGSICLDDFKLGWSDIDILILTKDIISEKQAKQLVNLRQTLLEEYKGNLYFRSFEGGILSINEFLSNKVERVVYWGTSGERIADNYCFDVFSTMELIDSGILIHGKDIRSQIQYPTYDKITEAVRNHYQSVRKYAVNTERNLYSVGWMLDIARCLYTLSEGKIISKTQAGYWAIENNFVPNVEVMNKALKIRENPLDYRDNTEVQDWLEKLGPMIQEFADVLERRLNES